MKIFIMPTVKMWRSIPAGTYKFLAVGRDASDLFSVTSPTSSTTYGDMLATISNTGEESEIFSGSADATITDQGARVSIEMTRKVAGILGYFKNIPQQMNGQTVRYLRLSASNSNKKVNLTTGTDIAPQPSVLLQRIITMLNLRRVFVDAQTALNSLTNNIVTQIGYKNIIKNTVQGALPGLLKTAMDLGIVGNAVYVTVGRLDAAVNLVVGALVQPVTDALYNLLLQQLVNEIGRTLSGNATQEGALGVLGSLLNPWRGSDASYALVTINNFPKAMDLDLNVTDTYSGNHRFRYSFTTTPGTTNSEKDILIRGFHGLFDVREIHVAKPGLISGLLVDDIIDGSLLLNGTFVNITDPAQATVETNYRYRSDYSFVSLGLKSYAQQTDGNHSLTLSVKLSNIANLDGTLGGIPILGPLLNATIKRLIGNVTVSVPVYLPLLGVDNLSLSGSWKTPPVKY